MSEQLIRMLNFVKILNDDFSDIVTDVDLHPDRLKITLVDNSWIEVRYPIKHKFSFHWQKGNKIYRIDTAPHHKHIRTYPRHIHFETEDNVIEDFITKAGDEPEDDFRNFMKWVREQLMR